MGNGCDIGITTADKSNKKEAITKVRSELVRKTVTLDREEIGEVLEIKTMQNILDTTMLLILWISAFAGHKIMKKIQPEIARLYLGYAIFICILVTGFGVAYRFQS